MQGDTSDHFDPAMEREIWDASRREHDAIAENYARAVEREEEAIACYGRAKRQTERGEGLER